MTSSFIAGVYESTHRDPLAHRGTVLLGLLSLLGPGAGRDHVGAGDVSRLGSCPISSGSVVRPPGTHPPQPSSQEVGQEP